MPVKPGLRSCTGGAIANQSQPAIATIGLCSVPLKPRSDERGEPEPHRVAGFRIQIQTGSTTADR